jgi:HK97 family phage prohead protease
VGKSSGATAQRARTVSGWITTFGNPDHVGDVIHEHAIDRHVREVGPRLPMLSGHNAEQMTGWHELKIVPGKGVWAESTFLEGIRQADEDLIRVKSGGMAYSIGFITRKEEFRGGNRWLMDIELLEASIVFLGCNPMALIQERSSTETEAALRKLSSTVRRHAEEWAEMRRAHMTPAERAIDRLNVLLKKIS